MFWKLSPLPRDVINDQELVTGELCLGDGVTVDGRLQFSVTLRARRPGTDRTGSKQGQWLIRAQDGSYKRHLTSYDIMSTFTLFYVIWFNVDDVILEFAPD